MKKFIEFRKYLDPLHFFQSKKIFSLIYTLFPIMTK